MKYSLILTHSIIILTKLSAASKTYDVAVGVAVKLPCSGANDPVEFNVHCPTGDVNYSWSYIDHHGRMTILYPGHHDDPRSRYQIDRVDGSLLISVTSDTKAESLLFQCEAHGIDQSCYYTRMLRYRKCGDEIIHKSGHVSLCKYGECVTSVPSTGHSQLKCRCQQYATGYFCDDIISDSITRRYYTPYIPLIVALMIMAFIILASTLCGYGGSHKVLAYGKHEEKCVQASKKK